MTSVFDGLTGVLDQVFGAPVTFRPTSGTARVVHSVFRETPVEVDGPEGPVIVTAPTWTVRKSLASDAHEGDRIEVADGRVFWLRASYPSGSPAVDSFVRWVLERQVGA